MAGCDRDIIKKYEVDYHRYQNPVRKWFNRYTYSRRQRDNLKTAHPAVEAGILRGQLRLCRQNNIYRILHLIKSYIYEGSEGYNIRDIPGLHI